jgi:serine/threonine protein kinase
MQGIVRGLIYCAALRQDLRDLIYRLLVHNPAQRLGVLKGGAADVKAHPWFHGFDWESFAQKKLKAPYMPVVRRPRE